MSTQSVKMFQTMTTFRGLFISGNMDRGLSAALPVEKVRDLFNLRNANSQMKAGDNVNRSVYLAGLFIHNTNKTWTTFEMSFFIYTYLTAACFESGNL